MPLKLPDNLPAIELLKKEHIDIAGTSCGAEPSLPPLHIAVLNLMPLKITTETDIARLLGNSPLQIEIDLMKIKNHTSKNTSAEHLAAFYKDFDALKDRYYDGMIITGAPVEKLDFRDVTYWDELTRIFDWTRTNVRSTLYICWAAQAALNHFYGVPKYDLPSKKFGIFKHTMNEPYLPIFRGFDDEFFAPHSRHTEIIREDIRKIPELTLLSESDEAGVYMVMAREGREFYITGHSEYAPYTLRDEYVRDVSKGLPITVPVNYYPNDDVSQPPTVRWRSHANLLFTNWLHYYVNDAVLSATHV
jgi:homoserine O-succinyltransferase